MLRRWNPLPTVKSRWNSTLASKGNRPNLYAEEAYGSLKVLSLEEKIAKREAKKAIRKDFSKGSNFKKFSQQKPDSPNWTGQRRNRPYTGQKPNTPQAKDSRSTNTYNRKDTNSWTPPPPPPTPVQNVVISTAYLKPLLQETTQLPFSRPIHLSPADHIDLRVLQETKPTTIATRAALALARNPTVTSRQRHDFIAKVEELAQ